MSSLPRLRKYGFLLSGLCLCVCECVWVFQVRTFLHRLFVLLVFSRPFISVHEVSWEEPNFPNQTRTFGVRHLLLQVTPQLSILCHSRIVFSWVFWFGNCCVTLRVTLCTLDGRPGRCSSQCRSWESKERGCLSPSGKTKVQPSVFPPYSLY